MVYDACAISCSGFRPCSKSEPYRGRREIVRKLYGICTLLSGNGMETAMSAEYLPFLNEPLQSPYDHHTSFTSQIIIKIMQ